MDCFGKKMTFEEERIEHERAVRLDALIQRNLDAIEGSVTPEKMVDAIGRAAKELDPDDGELKYEMDEEYL